MWQAMLKSAELPATDKVVYHGFINSGGQKMSKSLGNVISPYELVEKYGTDATRYILLRHVHPFDDSDVTWEKMDEWYTANLVNGLGNLTARIMKMAETHLDGPIALNKTEHDAIKPTVWSKINSGSFQDAAFSIWSYIQDLDEVIATEEPFKLVKTNLEEAKKMISALVYGLSEIGEVLSPFMPDTSRIIKEAILTNKKPENLFERLAE